MYRFRESTSDFITNYNSFYGTDDTLNSNENSKLATYIDFENGDEEKISDYMDDEMYYLIITSGGFFYFQFISFLDEDGAHMTYMSEALNIEWFLNNYEKGLFESDV